MEQVTKEFKMIGCLHIDVYFLDAINVIDLRLLL